MSSLCTTASPVPSTSTSSRKRKVEFSSLSEKEAREHKRAISRRSSQRHRQRERMAIEDCQEKKTKLEKDNQTLKAENESFRSMIQMLKQKQQHKQPQKLSVAGSVAASISAACAASTNCTDPRVLLANQIQAQKQQQQNLHQQNLQLLTQRALVGTGRGTGTGTGTGSFATASLRQFSNEELMEALIAKRLKQQEQSPAMVTSVSVTPPPTSPSPPHITSRPQLMSNNTSASASASAAHHLLHPSYGYANSGFSAFNPHQTAFLPAAFSSHHAANTNMNTNTSVFAAATAANNRNIELLRLLAATNQV
ncbi:expressed unknown protein [Seminavis robusta]|uniref:BZIP domain-containing protein n=1 Tax=Seminavis robusta TaxID=568900 RepID=A0A9N8EEM3_9STRA|nr:expressed unknown protein [Seminavis robusta]|eukprot:Sro888_g216440.1 n/a (309) ;mRNA; f:22081-23007